MMNVKHYDLSIDENCLENGLHSLISYLKPQWKVSDLKIKNFENGITNKLIGCYVDDIRDMVLVRIFGAGTEMIIDRKREKETMVILYRAGMSPPLHCSFNNGICYGYIDGETLDVVSVREPHMQRLIAKEMVIMHSISKEEIALVRGYKEKDLISQMPFLVKHFLSILPDTFDDPEKQLILTTKIPTKEKLEMEVSELLDHIGHIKSDIVYSHNDLLLNNIIYNKDKDEISFIDYEYCNYNYQFFDIADHFCEYAGVDDVDFSRYPDKETQVNFIRNYLHFWYQKHSHGRTVTPYDIERAYCHINKLSLLSHMMWGLWAMIQSKCSLIDFDFLSYGALRLGEYMSRKTEFFNLPFMNEVS